MKTCTEISIIIPCHDNTVSLPLILRSISASKYKNLEVICVDDQSSNHDIKQISISFGAKYYRLPEDEPGRRAMARNFGHKHAKGFVTLYLDGDIIPEPRLFSYCNELHQRFNRTAVKYPVYSITEQRQRNDLLQLFEWIVSHQIDRFGHLVTKHVGIDTRPLPKRLRGIRTKLWVLCASHCMSISKKEVDLVGGWDEDFKGWGEEDLELAYRLYKIGVDFLYPHRKNAAAYHLDHSVNWENNYISLQKNIRRFRDKHSDSWEGRRGILRMFLNENNLPTSLTGEG